MRAWNASSRPVTRWYAAVSPVYLCSSNAAATRAPAIQLQKHGTLASRGIPAASHVRRIIDLTHDSPRAIIDLTHDLPRANDPNKVNSKRGVTVQDSATLPGNKRALGGSARMTVAAELGRVDPETVGIACTQQKQSAVTTVGFLHALSRHQIGSDAAQPLARSCSDHPPGMQPPVPSMEIGVDTTQLLPFTRRSIATDLKWPESQVIPSQQCTPRLASRQRLCPSIRTDNVSMSSFFKRYPAAQVILPACVQLRPRSRS